jgi:hypothetical protein
MLDVTDTGAGIAAADLPRVFDRFYRADKARSEGGTGLGLAIARTLVEAHGGTLSVKSTVGSGTQVTVALPTGGGAHSRFPPGRRGCTLASAGDDDTQRGVRLEGEKHATAHGAWSD